MDEKTRAIGQAREQVNPVSQIVITFSGVNSVALDLKYNNVSPLQVIAAAWVLQKSAEKNFAEMQEAKEQQEQLSRIVVPGQMP